MHLKNEENMIFMVCEVLLLLQGGYVVVFSGAYYGSVVCSKLHEDGDEGKKKSVERWDFLVEKEQRKKWAKDGGQFREEEKKIKENTFFVSAFFRKFPFFYFDF